MRGNDLMGNSMAEGFMCLRIALKEREFEPMERDCIGLIVLIRDRSFRTLTDFIHFFFVKLI